MHAAVYTLLAAFAAGIVLGKILLPVLHKLHFGQNIYELAPEAHKKKQGTPTMGGLVIAGAALLASLGALLAYHGPWTYACALLILALANMGIGLADDLTKIRRGKNGGLTARQKLVLQTAAALIFSVYCMKNAQAGTAIYVPFLRTQLNLGILYVPITMFIVVGTTNSANLLDGLDGLLTSVSLVDFGALAVLAYAMGHEEMTLVLSALAGACMAFLFFNAYPARMFMGDTGSMFIGGAVSAAAVLLSQPLLLIFIAFWMMMSSLSDLIQFSYFRATHGKRIFKMAPIHHHFELSGIHEAKIVMIYMVTTLALSLLALAGTL